MPYHVLAMVHLTHVASKWCDLPIVRCYKQFLEGTTAFATSGMTCTCNGIVATDYLQWFTCDACFYSIEIIITSSHMNIHMEAYKF